MDLTMRRSISVIYGPAGFDPLTAEQQLLVLEIWQRFSINSRNSYDSLCNPKIVVRQGDDHHPFK
jgi:hypothetical protein